MTHLRKGEKIKESSSHPQIPSICEIKIKEIPERPLAKVSHENKEKEAAYPTVKNS